MQRQQQRSRGFSLRAVSATALVALVVLSTASGALAGRIEKFTGDVAEVGLELRAGEWDGSTTISFPPDCRVKDLSFQLRSDQGLRRLFVPADGGNVTAWASKPAAFDPRSIDLGPLENTTFTQMELTQVSLNSTATTKTTLSGDGAAHLFAYNLTNVLGGVERYTRLDVGWLGVGVQNGLAYASDDVRLYVSDFAKGMWREWASLHRDTSTGGQSYLSARLGPHGGWTDAAGLLYLLAVTMPKEAGRGSSLATSFVSMEVFHVMAPDGLEVDVAGDGEVDFAWNGTGTGLYGFQNELADGSDGIMATIMGRTELTNMTSFLVPQGAILTQASIAVTGVPGDVTAENGGTGLVIDGQGASTGTNVTGIPAYADPVMARVVLSKLKNAGMEDQKQTMISDQRTFGNYGAGSRSIAQTFVPSVSGKLVFVNISLEGAVYADAPDIIIQIRSTNAQSHPTGAVRGSGTLPGDMVNQSSSRWYRVAIDGATLSSGEVYAIVISAPTATAGQTYKWNNHYIVSGDPYASGETLLSDTPDGAPPWAALANTDQAFITYMETAIGTGIDYIKVNGVPYSATYEGPNGPELAYNITGVAKDALGAWSFTITNGNDFPVAMDWAATVHSDVYAQEFGMDLSAGAANVTLFAPWDAPLDLSDVAQVNIHPILHTVLADAPTAYTSPSGVEFARVNVSLWGNVTGAVVLDGLAVRYFLDVNVTGPGVVAAAEAYRAAHEAADVVELPIAVRSSCDATVLLSGPRLVYDLRPVFVTTTQTLAEDGNRTVDLDTLFGDDLDRGNLRYELRSVSDPANMTADLNGSLLTLVPAPDFHGELDVTVRGTDSSDLFKDGNVHVVVTPVNDLPVLSAPPEFAAQARMTSVVDLGPLITDVDSVKSALALSVNSSYISVDGLKLGVTFDEEGMYHVALTIEDGPDEAHFDLLFNVSAAVGYPSISASLPDPMKVYRNRELKVDLSLYASDAEDAPSELVWAVMADSSLFTASVNASGHWLIITPKGTNMGSDDILLTLTDTDDHTVSRTVTVDVIDRFIERPQIDEAALPDKIVLTKGGKSVVLELGDFVRDDTPVRLLLVSITYGADGIVYVDAQAGNLTFVPQDTGKTVVTVTLTDTDGLSSTFDVEVEVKPEGGEDEGNWWLWVALLVILAAIVIVVAWPKRPVQAPTPAAGAAVVGEAPGKRVDKVRPHIFMAKSLPQLEEVMLFHRDGTLLSQHTRALREGVDAEIEAGVISAIQDNLKGRVRTRGETPDLIELEGMRAVVERGADLSIATVLTGEEPDSLRLLMRRTLHEVQTRNEGALKDWKGDLASLHGMDNAIVGLVEGLIRESGGVPDRGAQPIQVEHRPPPRMPEREQEEEEVPREAPAAHRTDEGEPLRLVGGIIGEEKVQELREGRPKLHKEAKDDALVKEMLDREKEKEAEEDKGA